MRAFIAIDVESEEMKKLLHDLRGIKARIKTVEDKNIHLTLKFLGEIDENMVENVKNAMKKSVEGEKPFIAELNGVGVFPNINYMRVIWVGFKDDGTIKRIQQRLDEELQKYSFKKEKDFVPHVTIARVKGREGKENLKKFVEYNMSKSFGTINCDSIKLKKSTLTREGPIYEDIYEIKL
ncbi:MAG: RNA 2',3'-cyclic phosphodiesterase [Thermoplasmata archaeon]|nr:RNA 2',3'-cyclic phosphodiesterase [Thermoplasmata archaeon]